MKPIWIVILTIVLTGAVVGGGAYYYLSQKANNEKNDLQGQIDDLNTQIQALQKSSITDSTGLTGGSTAATDETTGWKTYTNSTYEFSFKYPADFSITDNLAGTGTWSASKKVTTSDSTDSLEIWVNPDGFGPFFPDYIYSISATSSGLSIKSKDSQSSSQQKDDVTLAIGQFTYGANDFLLHYTIKGSDTKPLTQFDQILSTFQFTK